MDFSMKCLNFESAYDLGNVAAQIYEEENLASVSFVGEYEETREFVEGAITNEETYIRLGSIELNSYEVNGYISEYITTIFDNEIWVEPFKRDNGYLRTECEDGEIIFVDEKCFSKVRNYIKTSEGGLTYKAHFLYGEEVSNEENDGENDLETNKDNCSSDCSECDCCLPKNAEEELQDTTDDMNTFSMSKNTDHGYYSFSISSDQKLDINDSLEMFKNWFDKI